MNGYFSAEVIGAVVESNVADKFRKAIAPLDTEKAIKAFIYSVINGEIKIAKESEKDETN